MLSIIIPIYNEEKLIDEMLSRVLQVTGSFPDKVEVLCVDDGSIDASLDKILAVKKNNSSIKAISLSRNFGLQAALAAGLEHAQGERIVIMDGDLQDPPEVIPELTGAMTSGNYDLVVGTRTERCEKGLKRLLIRLFHQIFHVNILKSDISDFGNFCILNKDVKLAILSMKEKVRYFPGLRNIVGFKTGYLEYNRDKRFSGDPKMTYGRLFRLALDAMFSFSRWPLKLCMVLGFLGIIIMLLATIYSILSKAMGWAPFGWSSTILSIYFIGSIQLVFMGVLGEYVFRTYKEVQNRPLYFIRKIYD